MRRAIAIALLAGLLGCKGNINNNDLLLALTVRASVATTGTQGNAGSFDAGASADGRFVAFASSAENLSLDGNLHTDIFLRDNTTGVTRLISQGSIFISPLGGITPQFTLIELHVPSNGDSTEAAVSGDGTWIAYTSVATNISGFQPTAGSTQKNIYKFSTAFGQTARVSLPLSGFDTTGDCQNPSISADGLNVAFESNEPQFVVNDTNGLTDAFWHDGTGLRAVSVTPGGAVANGSSTNARISGNGAFVAFQSTATNLLAIGDADSIPDIYLRQLPSGPTSLVSTSSLGVKGVGASHSPSISADGRYVVFVSDAANLVADDTNGQPDVFRKDLLTGELIMVSISSKGAPGDGPSRRPHVSDDGNRVSFESSAATLIDLDANNSDDIFVRDVPTGTTDIVSVRTFGLQVVGHTSKARISGDGRFVVMESLAPTLIDQDTNGAKDVFVRGPLR